MSKHKFNVGDKVIGTKKANEYGITREGWIGEVIGINPQLYGGSIKVSGKDGNGNNCVFVVDSEDFELFERKNPEKIIIYRNGSEVIAKNTLTNKTGVAKCNPADEFDFNTEAKLAFDRLVEPEPEKPKYYNGKVVCTKPLPSLFTKGKVYEVNDGVLDSDAGCLHYYRFKSFDDILVVLAIEFIELVE